MAAAPESIPADVVCDMLALYGVDVDANQFASPQLCAGIRAKCRKGTLLHKAAEDGDVSMVEAALAVGCEVDVNRSDGPSALDIAAAGGRVDVMRVLLDAGANPNRSEDRGRCWTPLFYAAYEGRVDALRVLLEAGADVMHVDFSESTALHVAARRGHPAAIHVLLDAGASVDATDYHADTPLDDALRHSFRNCLGPLLQAGATLDENRLTRIERKERNASAWRYIERVQAAGGYDQLVQTYRHVLTAPQSCLSWFLKFHCEIRFGLGAFPHDLVPLVLAFWKPPGGP